MSDEPEPIASNASTMHKLHDMSSPEIGYWWFQWYGTGSLLDSADQRK